MRHGDGDVWETDYIEDNTLGVNSVSWAPYNAYLEEDDTTSGDNDVDGGSSTGKVMRLVTGGCDNRIRFWKKSVTGGSSSSWEEDAVILGTSTSHKDWVRDVAWAPSITPRRNIVASCSEDGTVIIWTQLGGAESTWEPTLLHTFDAPVWRLSWSVTGSILAVSSGECEVTLWKQGLQGEWSQVSTVEDVASSSSNSVIPPQQPQQQ